MAGDEKKEEKKDDKSKPNAGIDIDIREPLAFWLLVLVVGLAFDVILIPVANTYGVDKGIVSLMTSIAGWILFQPGAIILPLITSVWIGERVGAKRNKIQAAVTIGTVNAAYTALLYVIAIFIIYLLIYYITPGFLTSNPLGALGQFVEWVVLVPVIIIIFLVPVISALSAARHNSM